MLAADSSWWPLLDPGRQGRYSPLVTRYEGTLTNWTRPPYPLASQIQQQVNQVGELYKTATGGGQPGPQRPAQIKG